MCNGSTTDFDSVSLGSIPSAPAKFYRYSIMDNTLRYERGDRGSIPFGGTKGVSTNSFLILLKDGVNSFSVVQDRLGLNGCSLSLYRFKNSV